MSIHPIKYSSKNNLFWLFIIINYLLLPWWTSFHGPNELWKDATNFKNNCRDRGILKPLLFKDFLVKINIRIKTELRINIMQILDIRPRPCTVFAAVQDFVSRASDVFGIICQSVGESDPQVRIVHSKDRHLHLKVGHLGVDGSPWHQEGVGVSRVCTVNYISCSTETSCYL